MAPSKPAPQPVTYTAPRTFRWYDIDNERHGIPRTLANGAIGETLCAKTVIPQAGQTMTSRQTCAVCDDAWRASEGLRTREELRIAIQNAACVPGQRGGK